MQSRSPIAAALAPLPSLRSPAYFLGNSRILPAFVRDAQAWLGYHQRTRRTLGHSDVSQSLGAMTLTHKAPPVVLVIDDDHSFIYRIKRYGQLRGARVITAPTLDTARRRISNDRPTLVLVHMVFQGPWGWNVVRVLKAEAGRYAIPIVACGTITEATGAWEAGADYWVSTPVLYDDFRGALTVAVAIRAHLLAGDPGTDETEIRRP